MISEVISTELRKVWKRQKRIGCNLHSNKLHSRLLYLPEKIISICQSLMNDLHSLGSQKFQGICDIFFEAQNLIRRAKKDPSLKIGTRRNVRSRLTLWLTASRELKYDAAI